ncbi:hypothetical protein PGTUg99_002883 [Puccinia graminis f. sp. tritici]|uniref:Uncharacterized protein n=1 Tax=Puccinia graminis f. sp. tritici TaxID=56615 RepID=A0A5B0SH71_PUCGR|nr:hypothetical protein PGTUg99_002883 [Puccinia graminis f. sp. tritici]
MKWETHGGSSKMEFGDKLVAEFKKSSCSIKEQEESVIVTCTSSNDVNDATGNAKNDDPDQSSSSSPHSYNTSQRKLISRIFPPIVDSSNSQ